MLDQLTQTNQRQFQGLTDQELNEAITTLENEFWGLPDGSLMEGHCSNLIVALNREARERGNDEN